MPAELERTLTLNDLVIQETGKVCKSVVEIGRAHV